MFTCVKCNRSFTRNYNLHRHQRESCVARHLNNSQAAKRVKNNDAASTSRASNITCIECNISVPANKMAYHLRTQEHKTNSCVPTTEGVHLIRSAFRNRIASYRVHSVNNHNDYKKFFSDIQEKVIHLMEKSAEKHNTTKINMEVFARYILPTSGNVDIKSFNTANIIIDQGTDTHSAYGTFVDGMSSQTTEFSEKDSGWALECILHLEVNVNKFTPLHGSSYIPLPKFIQSKKAVINVQNRDQHCFAWAVVSALFPATTNVCEVNSYPHYSTVINTTGMNFPIRLKDISLFEKLNNISINVYGVENRFENNKIIYEIVGPLRYAKRKLLIHINLLYVTDNNGGGHYCWIKDLSKLVSSQISKYEHRKYFCDGCLSHFTTQAFLALHQERDCNHVFTKIPTCNIRIDKMGNQVPENILKFENFEKQITVPFVVYADFESILKPINVCEPDSAQSFSLNTHVHEAYSFAYLIKSSFDDSVTKFVSYRGERAAEEFVNRLETDLRELYFTYLKDIVPMKDLSPQEQLEYDNADACNICDKPIQPGDVKVRDHCHITGNKRFGAAHSTCNLNYKDPNFIPIIFHNLTGYDCHLFIKQLCTHGDKIDVIAQNKEKYVSFTKNLFMHDYVSRNGGLRKKYLQMRFIDSLRFLPASLQSLSDNLDSDDFVEVRKHFTDDKTFNLMRQKGVFPYSFVDNLQKLNLKNLPTKLDFYDKLNDESIPDDDYARATSVWNTFKCKTLGEYSDIYLKSDVLMLCDVFENFRKMSLNKYKLDPCHYYTAPGLSWDAMLKYTNVDLELLTDIDMVNFFKKGVRGGVSQCTERKHEANNKYMPNYNPNEKSSYIMYLDATNLYGHSMSQRLPTGGFTWLSKEEINNFNINEISEESDEGFVLEVDIHYPQSLHAAHSDLPFLAENIIPPDSKSKISKLIPNVQDKMKYIVHYRNLKQAIQHGLVLTNIHRVLKFKQSCWLKKYIDLNTEMRNKAKSKFERDLYKLMNNAVFGKTMENVDNRTDIKLLTHWGNINNKMGAGAYISRPHFKSCSIFNENFVAIHLGKSRVNYCKPIYVGFCVLELSKTVMYDFFYGFIKPNFGDKAQLLYTDTDSLIIKIETDDFYEFMKNNIDKFDTSNYKVGNKFDIPITESILGKMKDEFPNDIIVSFYGTGAKAYYILSLESVMKKAKGVKKSVIKRELSGDDYKRVIENGGIIRRKMNTFKSDLHDIYTVMKNKVALSHHDDKRFIIPNTPKTLPWGHSDIEFYKTDPEMNIQFAWGVVDDFVNEVTHHSDHLTQTENGNLEMLISLMLEELD